MITDSALEKFKADFKEWEAKVESAREEWEHEERLAKAIEAYRECVNKVLEVHLQSSSGWIEKDGCSGKSE